MILPCIYYAGAGQRGRGMYTSQPLPAGKIIERSPVIVMDAAARRHLDATLLHDYIFVWQPEGAPEQCCMALGYVPLYNHAAPSNCEYFMDYDTQEIFVQTARDITMGEELFINYNGDWDNASPVWFETL